MDESRHTHEGDLDESRHTYEGDLNESRHTHESDVSQVPNRYVTREGWRSVIACLIFNRSFPAKEPYKYWLYWGKRPAT